MLELVEKVLNGNKRAAARLITLIENNDPLKNEALAQLYPHTGKAMLVGITGSPGAGKSSLVDELTKEIRKRGLKAGIIAVDPTSPISGGALLGDRIRMQEHALDKGVFIRSMGTRGCLGGLARATKDVIKVLDAYGCDVILVETVGVGQSELDIAKHADTTIVVLTPGAGDHIQSIKAGIMEIADIFAVNKADLPGAKKVVVEVEGMLDLGHHGGWRPPVVQTSTLDGSGVLTLWEAVLQHQDYIKINGAYTEANKNRIRAEITEIIENELRLQLWKKAGENGAFEELVEKVMDRSVDPYTAAAGLVKKVLNFN
ncbi:MAG: methylmalonyl Co-A mutase-associated GTPase MeaB [Peptococcaceae bacterium]|nr:methylmalonyl Co-A mutase-associated GTPase MeaB [Peptococcaceae bacterium]